LVTAGNNAANVRGPYGWRAASGAAGEVLLTRESLIAHLLAWYDRHRRTLPWRALPGQHADPYRVWLSEIMLQQTTVGAVIPYFERFLTRFPTVQALAAAGEATVMQAWAGLGYYARARNLHRCAQIVAAEGSFPDTADALRSLPGIGPYTATAIAAIAFNQPGIPIDGNVERVLTRLAAITTPLPQAKPQIAALAAELATQPPARARPSDTAQALFDLGATLCTPAAPGCALCPWLGACDGQRQGIAATLPRKQPKPIRPIRFGANFYLANTHGHLLLRSRPPNGLLGGMSELPGTPWRETAWSAPDALTLAPHPAAWQRAGEVRHVFTHFELRLDVYAAPAPLGLLLTPISEAALPSVMRKCIALAEKFLAR
jgi:A/G-specific adenine glycosylase